MSKNVLFVHTAQRFLKKEVFIPFGFVFAIAKDRKQVFLKQDFEKRCISPKYNGCKSF